MDSSRSHETAWDRLGEETGRPMPPNYFRTVFGRRNEHILLEILGWKLSSEEVTRLSRRKEEIYRAELQRTGIAPLPGVRELLAALGRAQVPCAIGSSTDRLNIDVVLDRIGLGGLFQAIVSAEDVTRGKPDPEVFLRAAERIGRPATACVVFEDSLAGLEAARAGGMKAVGVATSHPPEALAGMADRVVRRLDELSVEELSRLVS